jgi:hypothetical protein
MNEVHPDTLKALKTALPAMEALASLVDGDYSSATAEAADELRRNFPGVDDLALAAFAVYTAQVEVQTAKQYGSLEALGGAAAYASMALELAKSIRDPA